jgi:formylglycine-generating enzyme required for sulfatase activity
MRRRIFYLAAGVLLLGAGSIGWMLLGLPPLKFVLRYGLFPGCEPTGETRTIEEIEFIEIGPGIAQLGSTHLAPPGDWLGTICAPLGLPWGRQPKPSNEMPVRWVEFRRGFWIAKTEISNGKFARFDPNLQRFTGMATDSHPAAAITWEQAVAYCRWLEEKTGLPIRLPSEAEWECACRAGSRSEYCFGDDPDRLSEFAWFQETTDFGSREVGRKRANAWGLHDMHGNVQEWCADTRHVVNDSLADAPRDGSAWVKPDSPWRVIRGGSWPRPPSSLRSSAAATSTRDSGGLDTGFRVAFTMPE